MKKLLLMNFILNYTNHSKINNSELIKSYFNSDATRKTNNVKNLKYFIIIPLLIYITVNLVFSVIYSIFTKKIVFSFFFIKNYFDYKISEHNKKYLY